MGGRDGGSGKRAANLTISSQLLDKARRLNSNLSQTLEQRLAELLREAERKRWLEENRKAIEAFNAQVEREGVWSDKLRRF